MTRQLNYGLIGAGMMGHEHIKNVRLLDNVRVSAVLDPDRAMREAAVDLSGGAREVETIDQMLDIDDLDALIIASPNFAHLGQFEEIAAKRALPLLIEKPLYTDPGDAARVAALGASYPAPVWVAMEYRYMPPIQRLLSEAGEATGGVKMLTIREHRFPFLPKIGNWNRFNRNTGGTLVEKCCHFFDLMRLVIGDEPCRVMASAGQVENHRAENYDGEMPDIWDAGYVIVDFRGGARAMLELCMFAEGSKYQEEISAVGAAGKIECLVPGPGRMWPAHLGAPPVPMVIRSPRLPRGPVAEEVQVDPALLAAGDHNGSTFYQHQKFAEVVRGQGTPEVTLDDGARAVAMGMAAQKSAMLGQAVDL